MPFTPFHLGPGLAIGLPMRRHLHVPTFIAASVLVDVEPLLVLILGFDYPLHGYLHTFLLAVPAGLLIGLVLFGLERYLQPLYSALLLETESIYSLKSFLAAGALGTGLHVLLDTPLYSDITPFFPIMANPFYNPTLALEIYGLCVIAGLLGIVYYLGLGVISVSRSNRG